MREPISFIASLVLVLLLSFTLAYTTTASVLTEPLSIADLTQDFVSNLANLGQFMLSAGFWTMLLALVILIVVHEFGHWIVARLLGFDVPVFSIGFPVPKCPNFKLTFARIWGTDFQITPLLLGGFVSLNPADESFKKSAIWKRASVLVAGVAMNIIVAIICLTGLFAVKGQETVKVNGTIVADFSPAVPSAQKAGLLKNDQIIAVEQTAVNSPQDVITEISKYKSKLVTITVLRNNKQLTLAVPINENSQMGIYLAAIVSKEYKQLSPFTAFTTSCKITADFFIKTPYYIAVMAKIFPVPDGLPKEAGDVHGLIAIVQIGAQAYEAGFYAFISMFCMISLNLAIMNILPIPLLDGGHLLFLAIEKVKGKPISEKTQIAVCTVFFYLLIGLMFLAFYNDIFKPINF